MYEKYFTKFTYLYVKLAYLSELNFLFDIILVLSSAPGIGDGLVSLPCPIYLLSFGGVQIWYIWKLDKKKFPKNINIYCVKKIREHFYFFATEIVRLVLVGLRLCSSGPVCSPWFCPSWRYSEPSGTSQSPCGCLW